MKISIFGLGYVGTVMAGSLASAGHEVACVDISQIKIDQVNAGRSPIHEARMEKLISDAYDTGRLRATFDARAAVLDSEMSIITVGTPSNADGEIDMTFVKRVCTKVGQVLARKESFHTIVIRSTVLPGTTEEMIIPIIEAESGKKIFIDFDVCINPQFLRVGSLIDDFNNPPYILIGQQDDRAGDRVAKLYDGITAEIIRTSIRSAEALKYLCDAFHGVKMCFANEIGAVCKGLDIDSHHVMDLLRKDEKLNVSGAYLSPGPAFGGPSIGNSIRTLLKTSGVRMSELPTLASLSNSNNAHIGRIVKAILATGKKRIGLYGLAFKAGTDDLRESPMVKIGATLIENGCEILAYDQAVSYSDLLDSNKDYVESMIPSLRDVLAGSFDELFSWSDVIVVGHKDDQLEYLATLDTDKIIIDLVRIADDVSDAGGNYSGICW
ncbi:MAG: nucleotide sugar dehydrogenase [Candidatus Zixiibacteriota bacterium]